MSHWRDLGFFCDLKLFSGTQIHFEGDPTKAETGISALTPFCLCQWPLRGPSDAARVGRASALQLAGSEFIGHWGLLRQPALSSGLTLAEQQGNISEKLNPQEGPWAAHAWPTGPGKLKAGRLCFISTWGYDDLPPFIRGSEPQSANPLLPLVTSRRVWIFWTFLKAVLFLLLLKIKLA